MFRAVRLAIAIICIAAGMSAFAQHANVILEGFVYDNTGVPLRGARINLAPLGPFEGIMPDALSDQSGHFRLSTPLFGKTQISASKDDAGYPDATGMLFTSPGDQKVIVDLSADQPITRVEIHLGKPDGIICGLVVDKENRKAIGTARIHMAWANNPSVFYSATVPDSGAFVYALPERPITIKITAPGYRPWTYSDQQSRHRYLEIQSGERLPMLVELQREAASIR